MLGPERITRLCQWFVTPYSFDAKVKISFDNSFSLMPGRMRVDSMVWKREWALDWAERREVARWDSVRVVVDIVMRFWGLMG